jgi:glycosyltransferase involved in cell wall biosynthesis
VFAHANNSAALFVGHDMMGLLPARLLATRYRRPLVYHCHDFLERDQRLPLGTRLIRAFEQHFARTADIVIVPDAERAAVVAQALHLAKPPLVVANAPLNTPPATRAALYRALAAQGKQFARIVFRQGQIGDGHALEATMQSIPLWQSDQWGFVLMGPGQPAYLAHLTRLAHELGIEHQFAILPPVIYDEIHQFTAGADVGHGLYNPIHINHTYYTTASNKIMEYMAAGLPLLVSNMPGVRRLIETHQCGLGADENDPASIAMGINTLLGNPQQARAMGKAARRAFEAEFCYERQFVPMGEAFHRLIIAQK